MTKAFADEEVARIGWRRLADNRGECCQLCPHFCFRDAEKTRIGATGAFGHLQPCCRVLENVGGSVRKTEHSARCDNWERRP